MAHLPIPITGTPAGRAPAQAAPDPFVLRWRGRYYCYTSGEDGIRVCVSDDLEHFEARPFAYENPAEHSFWAPAAAAWNGRIYLYYASLPAGRTDDHGHFLRVAAAGSPLGPFRFLSTLTDRFAIDPHPVVHRGRRYLFYAANVEQDSPTGRVGTAIWLDELTAPDRLAGRGKAVLLPTLDEEIFARNRFGDGRDWHTLEGPCFVSDGVTGWLLYSGNAYTSPYYFIGCAAGTLTDDLCETVFCKLPAPDVYAPLVCAKNGVDGPGHNSVTAAPDHLTPVLVYHGRVHGAPQSEAEDRLLFTDSLRRCGNVLVTDAPSPGTPPPWPRPDLDFLQGWTRCGDGTCAVTALTAAVPAQNTALYTELCARPGPDGALVLGVPGSKEPLLALRGDFWQRAGALFADGSVRVRLGEEWLAPLPCAFPAALELKASGGALADYWHGTFLRGAEGNPLCCVL